MPVFISRYLTLTFGPALLRDCEAYAKMLVTDQKPGANGGAPPIPAVDFNNELEKKEVAKVFNAAMQCLSPEDRDLACVKTMLPILQRGVGVHHSGLLPILKELVEVLFQEQLIKCLFATETFAMGLNMPAKTVIFTTVKKWDGEENRTISSGEYIQMSGRAGRRGKDDLGFVLMLVDGEMDEASCRDMIQGKAKPLLSQFKLSYYTLLNLIRRAEGTGMSIAEVISRSFSQYQHDRDVPELKQRAEELRKGAEASEDTFKAMQEYLKLREQAAAARAVVQKAMIQPDKCIHVLRPGRIVRVTEGECWNRIVDKMRVLVLSVKEIRQRWWTGLLANAVTTFLLPGLKITPCRTMLSYSTISLHSSFLK